jgi:hypothetical protein
MCVFVTLFASLILAACGAATNSPVPSRTPAPVNLSNGSVVTRGSQSIHPPVFYDPAIRFGAWGSADPTLKATPASARSCDLASGSVDRLVGDLREARR